MPDGLRGDEDAAGSDDALHLSQHGGGILHMLERAFHAGRAWNVYEAVELVRARGAPEGQ